jgi:hypothetical protein
MLYVRPVYPNTLPGSGLSQRFLSQPVAPSGMRLWKDGTEDVLRDGNSPSGRTAASHVILPFEARKRPKPALQLGARRVGSLLGRQP